MKPLKKEEHYEQTLLHAFRRLLDRKDLHRLLKSVTILLTLVARLRYASVYLFNKNHNCFELMSERPKLLKEPVILDMENPVIKRLSGGREILNKGELISRGKEKKVLDVMERLNATVIIPCCAFEGIVGFLVFGDKKSGQHFTPDEIDTFLTLSGQLALAIENRLCLGDLEKSRSGFFQVARMASLGGMAAGLGHQINNRLQAIWLLAETLNAMYSNSLDEKAREIISSIVKNIKQAEETIERLRTFAKAPDDKVSPLPLKAVIEDAVEMVKLKKSRFGQIRLKTNLKQSTPMVLGSMSQLREVFFHLLDTTDDNIMAARTKNAKMTPTITVLATPVGNSSVRVVVKDNGMAHASPVHNTSPGLYIVERIIELQGGSIKIESEDGKGTKFVVELKQA